MGLGKQTMYVSLWLVALALSFALDGAITRWLYERSFHLPEAGVLRDTKLAFVMKLFGDFRTVLMLAVLLMAFAKLHWRQASVLVLCSAVSISAEVLKFVTGRARPLTRENLLAPTFDFIPLSLRDSGMSFPSGHAMLAFATAACLARYYPRWAVLAYSVATLVAAERVLELSHHLSDVVASCGLAILLSTWCFGWLEKRLSAGVPQPALQEEEIAA